MNAGQSDSHPLQTRGVRVLVVGLSTRAAGESAALAGMDVTCVDGFADRDQHVDVKARRVAGRFTARAVERAARHIEAAAVAYASPFENHPAAVQALAAGRSLWGNTPEVLRQVRDPRRLGAALRRRGFLFPDAWGRDSDDSGPQPAARGLTRLASEWLLKPERSGGGAGVRAWRPGERIPRGTHVQRRMHGEPWSLVFAAAGGRAVVLGLSRQLTGDPAFGGSGFRYCGSILDTVSVPLAQRAEALAAGMAEEFGLSGLNGIDFIRQGDEPVAIEVNPRWSGSMELLERAHGVSLFGIHAAVYARGGLPPASVGTAETLGRLIESGRLKAAPTVASTRSPAVQGKAIVFARRAVTIGDTSAWLEDRDIRDVPHAGERIAAGRPVCTVFACAADASQCYAALVSRADRIYARLAGWHRSVA